LLEKQIEALLLRISRGPVGNRDVRKMRQMKTTRSTKNPENW